MRCEEAGRSPDGVPFPTSAGRPHFCKTCATTHKAAQRSRMRVRQGMLTYPPPATTTHTLGEQQQLSLNAVRPRGTRQASTFSRRN
jgi:hypothetical protein